MDVRRLSKLILTGGIVTLIGAVVWWALFYNQVFGFFSSISSTESDARFDAQQFLDALPCLYSNEGGCGFVSGLAKFGGATPYTPIIFWIGLGASVIGLLMFSLSRPSAG